MRLISFGLLNLNYYLQGGYLSLIGGSRQSINIMANLSNTYECVFYGAIGQDYRAKILVQYIKELNINLIAEYYLTRTPIVFYEHNKCSSICPYCNRDMSGFYNFSHDIEIDEDDILLLDNLNDDTYNIIKNKSNKIFMLLTSLGDLKYKSLEDIKEIFSLNFKIICLTKNVYNSLSKKYLIDEVELANILHVDELIIVDNNLNCLFIRDEIEEEKTLEGEIKIFESSGGYEAFFSEFINSYLANQKIDEKINSKNYIKACSIALYVFKNFGPLPHVKQIKKIGNYENCICDIIWINR